MDQQLKSLERKLSVRNEYESVSKKRKGRITLINNHMNNCIDSWKLETRTNGLIESTKLEEEEKNSKNKQKKYNECPIVNLCCCFV